MTAIVCVSQNWGIGREGALLFHISADLKRFKSLTVGRTVILGRKTLDTFPTRRERSIPGAEIVHSFDEAIALGGDDALVIGGASVYMALLDRCERVCVTKVYASADADSFFPCLDSSPDWRIEHESEMLEENGLKFQFVDYVRN